MVPKRFHLKAVQELLYGGVRLTEIFSGKTLHKNIPPLAVRHVPFTSERLNAPNIRIASAADFHYGSFGLSQELLEESIGALNDSRPDIILLGGDFLNNRNPYNGGCGHPYELAYSLRALEAPLGVYAVLGNHDWDNDAEGLRCALDQNGIRVLENESVELRHGGEFFRLVGIGDYSSGKQRLGKAFYDASAGESMIALAHNPTSILGMPFNPAMTFSGHTHGGQFELPGIPFTDIRPRYIPGCAHGLVLGLAEKEGRHVHISAGLGTSIIPWRSVAPEIVVFDLVSAQGSIPSRPDRGFALA